MPLIGASGAVAGLMGAFLVRFPKLKIEMALFAFYFRYKFFAPAYWLLPLWLALEFFYGAALGQASPVAHWAHVGGFLFGMAAAFAIQRSGLEQKANDAIESKISWSSSPDIVQANELIEQGNLDSAAALLDQHLASSPPTFEALTCFNRFNGAAMIALPTSMPWFVFASFSGSLMILRAHGNLSRNIPMPAALPCRLHYGLS